MPELIVVFERERGARGLPYRRPVEAPDAGGAVRRVRAKEAERGHEIRVVRVEPAGA